MPFYEIILKAEVRKTLTVQAADYDTAFKCARNLAQDELDAEPAVSWEVDQCLVLDDEEVVRAQAKGVL